VISLSTLFCFVFCVALIVCVALMPMNDSCDVRFARVFCPCACYVELSVA